jgi:hypothetical protein
MTETSEEERTQKLASLSLSHDCRRSRSKTLNKVLKTNKKQKEKTTTQPQKPTENQGKKSRLTDLLLLTTSSRAS